MPRLILTVSPEARNSVADFLRGHTLVESFLDAGPYVLVNYTGSETELLTFLETIRIPFPVEHVRTLCGGKCRDGTDCLSTAKYGGYCQKHSGV